MKRVLQPRTIKVNADPSSTNLIVKRPFSYKVETSVLYASQKLVDSYAAVFPELNTDKIRGCRIDRVAVWGSDTDSQPPLYLAVGDFFSRRDIAGKNQRARICCVPKLEEGQSDENTSIVYSGAVLIHIEGIAYLDRETIPTTSGAKGTTSTVTESSAGKACCQTSSPSSGPKCSTLPLM